MVKIYSQGNLDGACFLYAIANSYKALSGKQVSPTAWSKALNWVCYIEDFMDRRIGTERYNDNTALFELVITNMLNELSSFEVKHVKCSNLESIKKLISQKSVAMFCYKIVNSNGKEIVNHWTCGVDMSKDPLGIHVACSDCEAVPKRSDKFNRWYNEIITSNDTLTIFDISVFQIMDKS